MRQRRVRQPSDRFLKVKRMEGYSCVLMLAFHHCSEPKDCPKAALNTLLVSITQ